MTIVAERGRESNRQYVDVARGAADNVVTPGEGALLIGRLLRYDLAGANLHPWRSPFVLTQLRPRWMIPGSG